MKTSNKYLALAVVATALSGLASMNAWGIAWDEGCNNSIEQVRSDSIEEVNMLCFATSLPFDSDTMNAFNSYSRDPQSGDMYELRQTDNAEGEVSYIETLGLTRNWCQALAHNSSVRRLSISFDGRGTPIPVENERAFADAIAMNRSLESITLRGSIQNLLALGDAIAANQHINELLLELYNSDDRVVLARNIMHARIQNNITTPLTITINCGIPDGEASSFADLIRRSRVTIIGRGLSPAAAGAILRDTGILCRPSFDDDGLYTIDGRLAFSRK